MYFVVNVFANNFALSTGVNAQEPSECFSAGMLLFVGALSASLLDSFHHFLDPLGMVRRCALVFRTYFKNSSCKILLHSAATVANASVPSAHRFFRIASIHVSFSHGWPPVVSRIVFFSMLASRIRMISVVSLIVAPSTVTVLIKDQSAFAKAHYNVHVCM